MQYCNKFNEDFKKKFHINNNNNKIKKGKKKYNKVMLNTVPGIFLYFLITIFRWYLTSQMRMGSPEQ